MKSMIEPVPQKRKLQDLRVVQEIQTSNLVEPYLYGNRNYFKPTPIPTEHKSKKRKLNYESTAKWAPDFPPTKKKARKKKQPKNKRSAGGYKGSTDQAKKLCEYCHQHSTLSVHGRYYLCNSKTQPGLKICNACKSWEYRNGNLVPRDQRRKAYHSRPKATRTVDTQRYYNPTNGTSVEVYTDSSDTETDHFTTLALNDSPDIRPVGQTSEYEGVSWDATYGKWKAEYGKGSEFHVVGLFDLEIDAAKAYAQTVETVTTQRIMNVQKAKASESLPFIKLISAESRARVVTLELGRKAQKADMCEYCHDSSKDGIVRLSGMSNLKLCLDCYQYEALHSKLVPRQSR